MTLFLYPSVLQYAQTTDAETSCPCLFRKDNDNSPYSCDILFYSLILIGIRKEKYKTMGNKKQIKVRLLPDGSIEAETLGVKGKNCLKYMMILEEMMHASIRDSSFTEEFYENEDEIILNEESVRNAAK